MLALIFEHISGTNLRAHGRPVQEAAALLLAVLCQLVATRNRTARGWRGRAPLLIGFAGAIGIFAENRRRYNVVQQPG